jgi:hypothetical protein
MQENMSQLSASKIYLSTSYFGPVHYFARLIHSSEAIIEKFENYSKQSYRNRCEIFGANGKLSLSIPILIASRKKILIKDVKISYDTNWQKLHWKTIESAYRNSPFYEYFIDEFEVFFVKKFDFLYDFNLQIIKTICKNLKITIPIIDTEDYIFADDLLINDFREIIHPKKDYHLSDPEFNPKPYFQVFSDKLGFISNLSILDVLFNLGNQCNEYLRSCIKNPQTLNLIK